MPIRNVLESEIEVLDYVERCVDKQFRWSISPEVPEKGKGPGKTPTSAWVDYRGIDWLPRGVRILFQDKAQCKGGIHILLPRNDTQSITTSPENYNAKVLELQQWERRLLDIEHKLIDRARDIDEDRANLLSKTAAIQGGVSNSLEKWHTSLERLKISNETNLKDLDGALDRARKAEESSSVAASVAHGIDRMALAITAWRMDKDKDTPKEIQQAISQGLTLLSLKRYYEHLPEITKRQVKDYSLLSKEDRIEVLRQQILMGPQDVLVTVNEMIMEEKREAEENAEE